MVIYFFGTYSCIIPYCVWLLLRLYGCLTTYTIKLCVIWLFLVLTYWKCFFHRWFGCAYCVGKNKSSSASLGNGLTTVWLPQVVIPDVLRCRPRAWCQTRGPSLKGRIAQWRRKTHRCCSGPTVSFDANIPNRSRPAGKNKSTEFLEATTSIIAR
jgi:hypothetical protein